MTPTRKRWIPSLFNFVMLLAVWLLLTNSFSFGNILLAAFLAWLIPFLVADLHVQTTTVKKPGKALAYLGILLYDIIVSNIIVAKQILGPMHKLQPAFITIPLDMSSPLPVTLLASSISLTPGTVSTEVSADMTKLYVHALHVDDEAELIAHIKKRYEAPLKEIFGC
jgi:multicomponent K+:H+ antiporter subunit E